jgi:ATP-binding cassette subfamily B protein
MKDSQSIIHLLKRLWRHLSKRHREQFGMLLFLMLLTSFAEILSIGSIIPFLAVLTSPESVFEYPLISYFTHVFQFNEPWQLILPLTIIFGLLALISGVMRLILLRVSNQLSFSTGGDLSIGMYRRTLYQSYSVHCSRNSSEVINGISGKAKNLIAVINMMLTLISALVMLVSIFFVLLSVNPYVALIISGGFGFIYLVITRITRRRLKSNSQLIARESSNVIKSLQEGLGGIRDILIDGSQEAYCSIYNKADSKLRNAMSSNAFINSAPRYGIEALAMIIIAALAYKFSLQADGISQVIPVLGALALGAQRLLPVLQQAFASWAGIGGSRFSLQDALELLDQPLPDHANQTQSQPISFQNSISLKKLDFRYNNQSPFVLKQINLTILKGDRIGFIGNTGSGKSTLLDIVMGLLHPTAGTLEIDNRPVTHVNKRAWQSHIAHVPQAIFLTDSTIAENIAFGVPKEHIDLQRIKQVAQQAQIAESIEKLPKQYDTFVGERGVRLSGGQRQRIGIARALYKRANVIVFDEATSALDNGTEESVMQAIECLGQDLTLLIIAHRITTLRNCKQIVELHNGEIKRMGTYQEMIGVKRF